MVPCTRLYYTATAVQFRIDLRDAAPRRFSGRRIHSIALAATVKSMFVDLAMLWVAGGWPAIVIVIVWSQSAVRRDVRDEAREVRATHHNDSRGRS